MPIIWKDIPTTEIWSELARFTVVFANRQILYAICRSTGGAYKLMGQHIETGEWVMVSFGKVNVQPYATLLGITLC
jgi:hypothetical protein